MALSNSTVSKLADALAPEVIDHIYMSDRWVEFMHEVVPDAVKEKLGDLDDDLMFDLSMMIMDKICLKSAT
jgi:hypothetical protein